MVRSRAAPCAAVPSLPCRGTGGGCSFGSGPRGSWVCPQSLWEPVGLPVPEAAGRAPSPTGSHEVRRCCARARLRAAPGPLSPLRRREPPALPMVLRVQGKLRGWKRSRRRSRRCSYGSFTATGRQFWLPSPIWPRGCAALPQPGTDSSWNGARAVRAPALGGACEWGRAESASGWAFPQPPVHV